MEANQLFEQALGLGSGWKVIKSELDTANKQLRLELDFERGSQFACPKCGEYCPVHDTRKKRWRHLDFWQHRTELSARVPRICCEEHGVLQVEVPWGRAGSGFTLMMEAMILLLARQMSFQAAAAQLGESDHRVFRVAEHYVEEAWRAADWSKVRRLLIDEVSTEKGHKYATNFMDAEGKRLLFTTPGKDADVVSTFAQEMKKHGADPQQITEVVMDMSGAFIAGARREFPNARIVFDHFHLIKLAGEATDTVRKELNAEGVLLKNSMWALRGNEWNLSEKQRALRSQCIDAAPALGRALMLKSALQDVLADGDPELLRWWTNWAQRSRLQPFVRLARTIRKHWEGILAFMETRLTNAAMEAINGCIQLAKRIARGFRNFHYFRTVAFLRAGRLDLKVPTL